MEIKEMIEVLMAFEEGKEIESKLSDKSTWNPCPNPIWEFYTRQYRIKPQPTREEITAKWIKDNNIVVGSKVTINGKVYAGNEVMSLSVGIVDNIQHTLIAVRINGSNNLYEVESLEPYKEQFVPFTHLDYELFCDRWVKTIKSSSLKFRPIYCDDMYIGFMTFSKTYEECFNDYVFIDGTPFGKLK